MFTASLDGVLLAGAIALLGTAALLPVVAMALGAGHRLPLHALPRLLGALGGALAAAAAAAALAGSESAPLEFWPGFPTQPFTLGLDALSAPFVLLFGVVTLLSFGAHATVGRSGSATLSLHAGFALALLVAIVARHGLLFLAAWEGMTLLSAALVSHEPKSSRARRATYVYLGLSHLGTALIAYALLTLGAHGGWSLEAMAMAFASLPPGEAATLVWCLTAGFAVKAGLVPLHGWLPLAHPEAPSPVSALLSGVMVKVGLYGLLRFAWAAPGSPPEGWGTLLLLTGLVSALMGALYCAVESDAKRLLAWSTIQHSGVIAMAIGLAAMFHAAAQPDLARLAMAAALVHIVGHGLAKAGAFLAIGEFARAIGSRDLEQWGGLARRMPGMGVGAVAAMAAVAGLPAFSVFAGEWLLLQALLHGTSAGAGQLRLLAPFAVAGLALATALSLGACAKLIGIGLFGRPRSEAADAARECSALVTWTVLVAALSSLAAGLLAPQLLAILARPLAMMLPGAAPGGLSTHDGITLTFAGAQASPLGAVLLVALLTVLASLLLRAGARNKAVRRAPSWTGGTPIAPRTQYSSLGFARPIRLLVEPLFRSGEHRSTTERGTRYSPLETRVQSGTPRMFERPFVAPLVRAVLLLSDQARRFQSPPLHLHIACLLLTLVALLVWGRG